MAVEVNDKDDIVKRWQKLADVVYLRMHPLVRLDPLSIQVETSKICPKITIDNSIRIDHRYHYHLKIFEKFLIRKQTL